MAAEPPPVSAFFKRPSVRAPKLSPSGRYLAIQAAGRNDRMWLAVLDLQDMKSPKFVAGFNDADIAHHHWVNEDRLVFDVSDSPDGTTRVVAQGLWAVDRDGSKQRQLINSDKHFIGTATLINDRRLDINWTLRGVPPGLDGNEVIVLRRPWSDDSEAMGVQLARLDTRTGLMRTISQGIPDYTRRWLLDWRGEPYLVETEHQGRVRSYRRDAEGRWQPWVEDDPQARKNPLPTWVGPDDLMLGEQGSRGYAAVFKLDPKTGRSDGEPLVSTPGYDFEGSFITEPGSGRLLGVRYETDAPGTAWLDAGMKAVQADIDARLPGSINLIECLRCVGASHLVVTSLSDLRPPLYYLYKTADKSLQPLAGTRPDLPPAAMGQRDYHRVKMRDGLEIPVLVTQPAGGVKRATPTVVLVHGGPYLRGTNWAWERDAQFLASRGYLVLEPEFRGSTGYGWRHFRAGWKQWGLAMQDDIGDTLAWAVKQGWADPKRACIAGASYGGYAALMGAVTQADLFKCAVSWVGVTDIGLLSSISWSDASDEWRKYGMRRLIADPATDAEQIRKTSPLQRAAEVRLPLLVAYGAEDRRVPLKHGTDFKSALRADQPMEWVVYGDEGHGWFNLKTNEDFWGRVERFLGRHIGNASTP
ncbi:prolyl oligopeptidase family serine peptidase [Roseateles asaccharophilus]|uniref:Dipeptidyl aminopeptidase/acylaminoacyl peptidase n=1 Tax=Roseateles asaccharophilus TaxID=582607 RepID=A0ABU2A806_9BURK|nr:prolyl oligopeptidase family serine peptidase [Roseateles asaccharophilus]MDR7333330.1 dipeptidyl aminopeptidase/acylaminoacyl peptidase [Roseateles asaccharophilus]